MNIFITTELYTYKCLRWQILCYVHFTIMFKKSDVGPDWCGSVGWAWVCEQKAASSIPCQSTYLGCGFTSRLGHVQEATIGISFSCRCFSPSLPLCLKINKIFKEEK